MFSAMLMMTVATAVSAQTTVKGRVTDKQGEPVIGATISLLGQKQPLCVTDAEGNYHFTTKRNLNRQDKIVFSFVGYKKKRVAYNGSGSIDVELEDDAVELDNVVVTALGIKRSEKGLGFSTQTVNGDDISATMPSNWSLALQGEVAGLNVTTAGGPLSSSKISLRGDVSMNIGGNGALVVVDGVPLSSPMNNPGGSYGAQGLRLPRPEPLGRQRRPR